MAADAAVAAEPAADEALLAASTAALAAEAAAPVAAAAAAAAEGASTGAGTTTTAGAVAGTTATSFLPQADRAKAATTAAKTRDLFIFTILDDVEENNFLKLSKPKPKRTFKLCNDLWRKGVKQFLPSHKLYAGKRKHENP